MLPHSFSYDHGQLSCQHIPLQQLATEYGTPLYLYSRQAIVQRAATIMRAARGADPRALVCYAVKANGNVAVIRTLSGMGFGADVTSAGELYLAQQAGIPPEHIIFSGVGKRDDEIEMAIHVGIHALHVESVMEYDRIALLASGQRRVLRIGVRVNPDVQVDTHAHISTGKRHHKFGVSPEMALRLLQQADQHPYLEPVGLAAHIGSQIRELSPFVESATLLAELAEEAATNGVRPAYLDVGGGLAIGYGEQAPDPAGWVAAVSGPVTEAGYRLTMEPGRSLVGPAGVLLTRVLYLKDSGDRRFVVVDAGMTELIRPALYQASHPILPCQENAGQPTRRVDVVGPVCETGDVLAYDIQLPPLAPGDVLAITDAGAYGFAMSSNYNGRLRPAELMIDDGKTAIIRPRQTLADLLH